MTWLEFADKHAQGLWFLAVIALFIVFGTISEWAKAVRKRRGERDRMVP